MIRNIIFDMGGVLIRFDRAFFIQRLGIGPEDEALLMREVFRSLEWARMDRGSLTDAEAAVSICARVPEHLHDAVRRLVSMWDRPILPIEGMEELIRELKEKGYHIFLLSNASFRQHDYWPRIPASRYFEDTLVSADVGLVKPQPEIYRLAFEKFRIKPEESVFIDDAPANIEGAYYVGMPGIIFNDDVAAVRKQLAALGVDVAQAHV
ncbi:MAG: HAD family phosphatase [Blautia sp.]|nr:HAD family phosphatase [Blautia sp.]